MRDLCDFDPADLTDDGDVCEVAGATLRLRVEPDAIDPLDLMDSTVDGQVSEWTRHEPWMRPSRPVGFDGAARIICRDGGFVRWWQPPAAEYIDARGVDAHHRYLRDILDDGAWSVGLEVLGDCDAYGRRVVTDCEWLGGILGLDSTYLAEILTELAAELAARLTEVAA